MDSFELDLGTDGVREAIRLIDTYSDNKSDQLYALQEARRALVDAYNALLAVTCPEEDPEGPEIQNGVEF